MRLLSWNCFRAKECNFPISLFSGLLSDVCWLASGADARILTPALFEPFEKIQGRLRELVRILRLGSLDLWLGRAVQLTPERRRALFEPGEFARCRSRLHCAGNPKGHATANMVLGPFAETKGSRRMGPKPHRNLKFLNRKDFR